MLRCIFNDFGFHFVKMEASGSMCIDNNLIYTNSPKAQIYTQTHTHRHTDTSIHTERYINKHTHIHIRTQTPTHKHTQIRQQKVFTQTKASFLPSVQPLPSINIHNQNCTLWMALCKKRYCTDKYIVKRVSLKCPLHSSIMSLCYLAAHLSFGAKDLRGKGVRGKHLLSAPVGGLICCWCCCLALSTCWRRGWPLLLLLFVFVCICVCIVDCVSFLCICFTFFSFRYIFNLLELMSWFFSPYCTVLRLTAYINISHHILCYIS